LCGDNGQGLIAADIYGTYGQQTGSLGTVAGGWGRRCPLLLFLGGRNKRALTVNPGSLNAAQKYVTLHKTEKKCCNKPEMRRHKLVMSSHSD